MRFTVRDSPDYYQLKVSIFNDDKKTELIGEAWIDLTDVVKYCAPNILEAYESLCRFRTGQWQLFREGFIQPYSPDIADEQHVKLTAYAFQVLLPEIPVPAAFQSSLLRVILPDAITPEALFFEPAQQE